MIEVLESATLCGVIAYNDDWCDVYCDDNGVLLFDNYTDGMWCITEVNIGTPLAIESSQDLVDNIDSGMYGDCEGVIYGHDGTIVVLLSGSKAVKRYVWAPKENAGEVFYYSTDEEYEPE